MLYRKYYKEQASLIGKANEINNKIRRIEKRILKIDPYSKVKGFRNTFKVDLNTKEIFIVRKDKPDKILEGYLTHENNHLTMFPLTASISTAFFVTVKVRSGVNDNMMVKGVTNIVADAFSDLLSAYFSRTIHEKLANRIKDFYDNEVGDITSLSPAMQFKIIVYELIRTTPKGKINYTNLDKALDSLKQMGVKLDPEVIYIADYFVRRTLKIASNYYTFRFNLMFSQEAEEFNIVSVSFLVDTAVNLLRLEQKAGGGGGGYENHIDMDYRFDDPLQVDNMLFYAGVFGVYDKELEQFFKELEAIMRKTISELVKKIRVRYGLKKHSTRKYSYRKESSKLWMKPMGEVDEDSVLIEKRKLLWDVYYKKKTMRKGDLTRKAMVPEKVVILFDESGSELTLFGNKITRRIAQALITLHTLVGIREFGGAKEIVLMKFSDDTVTYRDKDIVSLGVKIFTPSPIAFGDTIIDKAVEKLLKHVDKKSAVIIVTDAVITPEDARRVVELIKRKEKLIGFLTFIIVNDGSIEVENVVELGKVIKYLKENLKGENMIVEHVENIKQLEKLLGGIVNKITKLYGGQRDNIY